MRVNLRINRSARRDSFHPPSAFEDLRWRLGRGFRSITGNARELLDRRVGLAILAALVLIEAGIAGYQIGYSGGIEGPQADLIQREAYRGAFERARDDAAAGAAKQGAREGRQAGLRAGQAAGARAGERRGSAAAARRNAAIADRKALAAAERRQARQAQSATTAAEPVTTPTPAPAPTPTPAPAPTQSQQSSNSNQGSQQAPCFDASGRPC